jgi:hypothetical protein
VERSIILERPSISRMIQGPSVLGMPASISGWPIRLPVPPASTSATAEP